MSKSLNVKSEKNLEGRGRAQRAIIKVKCNNLFLKSHLACKINCWISFFNFWNKQISIFLLLCILTSQRVLCTLLAVWNQLFQHYHIIFIFLELNWWTKFKKMPTFNGGYKLLSLFLCKLTFISHWKQTRIIFGLDFFS